jgi:hypothetical protein
VIFISQIIARPEQRIRSAMLVHIGGWAADMALPPGHCRDQPHPWHVALLPGIGLAHPSSWA